MATQKVRYIGINERLNLPVALVTYDNESSDMYVIDLPADVDRTDADAVREYAKGIIESNHGYTLNNDEDIPVLRQKLDDWLADPTTATTDEILIDLVTILRDKTIF